MADGEDWLMRPVIEKMCSYKDLIDGTYGLEDVVIMNEAIDVKYENECRWHEHEKQKAK